eukprot:ctg_415.g136
MTSSGVLRQRNDEKRSSSRTDTVMSESLRRFRNTVAAQSEYDLGAGDDLHDLRAPSQERQRKVLVVRVGVVFVAEVHVAEALARGAGAKTGGRQAAGLPLSGQRHQCGRRIGVGGCFLDAAATAAAVATGSLGWHRRPTAWSLLTALPPDAAISQHLPGAQSRLGHTLRVQHESRAPFCTPIQMQPTRCDTARRPQRARRRQPRRRGRQCRRQRCARKRPPQTRMWRHGRHHPHPRGAAQTGAHTRTVQFAVPQAAADEVAVVVIVLGGAAAATAATTAGGVRRFTAPVHRIRKAQHRGVRRVLNRRRQEGHAAWPAAPGERRRCWRPVQVADTVLERRL